MKTNTKHWIVYDGNCGMCLFSKKVFSKLGFFKVEDCRNYHELDAELYQKVDLERFKHGMAYVDSGKGATRYGLEGVLAAFAVKRPYLNSWKPGTVIFQVLNFLYNAICYNRYFIFPMKQQFACSCEPEFKARYFRRWVGLGLFFSILISALFGLSLANLFEEPAALLALKTVAIVGAGWAVQMLWAAMVMSREMFRDYLRHLALIMFIGVLILLPATLLFWLPGNLHMVVALVSVALSSGTMLKMHIHRIRFMGLGQQWTFAWFVSLQATAIPLMFYFKLLSL